MDLGSFGLGFSFACALFVLAVFYLYSLGGD